MKAFRQTIQELSANDKLDKLGHNKPLSGSRLKQLSRDFSAYEDIDLDQWQGYPPPRNSSQVTKNEIHNLVSLGQFRDQWERDMIMHDKKVIQAFKEYLDKHGLEVDLDRIEKLRKQASPILLSLKRFYNRPRPQTLAKKLGLDLTFFPLTTAETPSYPSGHATQGRLVAKLVADEVPFEHRRNLLDIGERIGHSRQIAGAHYASDTEFGHRLGDELYRLASTRKEPELSLEYLSWELDMLYEIEFSNPGQFKAYNSKHKMRPTTKVKIGGKKTTAKAADPDAFKDDEKDKKEPKKEPKKEKGVEPTHTKPSPAVKEHADKIHKGVKEDLDFIISNVDEVRTQGGAGTNSATKQQVQDLGTFTEKRMAQSPDEEPWVHPNVVQREIDDETLDTSIDYLKENLGEEKFEKLIRFISKGGGVDSFLTRVTKKDMENTDGYKRSKEILRLYLKNDGKCVVTGEPMKLSECEPDHRIPYSSAKVLAEEKGISLEEAKRQMDNVQGNMDLMQGPVNQFKSSLINDGLLNKIRKSLAKTDDAREIKKLENEYKNERQKRLRAYYKESFGKGDYSSMTESNIDQMNRKEKHAMIKEYNYYHPDTGEYNKQIKKDPDYEKKLKAAGIILPKTAKGKLDSSKPPCKFFLSRYKEQVGGSRGRGVLHDVPVEQANMIKMFRKSGKECPLISEQKESNKVINEQRLKIRKEMNKKQAEIERIKLKNPKLSDRQKANIEKKIKKLSEQRMSFKQWIS